MPTEEQRKRYNAKKLEWYYKNREQQKKRSQERAWQIAYGISRVEYEQMLAKQYGVCKICLQPETATYKGVPRQLSVDHDHKTGRVRGLLCVKCNALIGFVEEDALILKRMLAYLEQNNGAK